MAATYTLQNSLDFCRLFVRGLPLVNVGQVTNEPALSIANWVRQFLLSPPFAWRWNRVETTFSAIAGTQDYVKNYTDFGWLEKASWTDGQNNSKELAVVLDSSIDATQNEPVSISAFLDDDSGNITLRLFPTPDKNYTIRVSYQQAAPNFVNLTDLWDPLPDYLQGLYNQGFLAKAYEYWNDERFAAATQIFLRQAIAMNGGLTDSQINVFLLDREITQNQELSGRMKTQLSTAGRSLQ